MKKRDRNFALAFAAAGTSLLLWKGWQGLVLFLADVVETSAEPTQNFSAVLPGFLICIAGVVLLASAHLIVLWKSQVRSRIFDIATGVSLWLAARFLLKAFSGVIKSFTGLGLATVHELRLSFDFTKMNFFMGIGFFCLAAFIRAGSSAKTHLAAGKGVRWLETSGWILSILVFLYASLACLRIDRLIAGNNGGQVDPSELANGILHILPSLSLWSMLSFAIGIVIIISAAIARPVAAEST